MTPGLFGRHRLRALFAKTGDQAHWDAVDVDTGERRLVATRDGELVGAIPLDWTLDEVVDGGDDEVLAAQLAVALASAGAPGPGPEPASRPLASRIVATRGVLRVLGPVANRGEARAAYLLVAPSDRLGLAEAVGLPGSAGLVVRALGTYLASERHLVARRAGVAVHDRRLQRLRGAAARLARFAPPVQGTGTLTSDGVTVAVAAGAVVFDGKALDARATRAALRATAGLESPLRRWLSAMSRLRVDREILARR